MYAVSANVRYAEVLHSGNDFLGPSVTRDRCVVPYIPLQAVALEVRLSQVVQQGLPSPIKCVFTRIDQWLGQ